MTRDDGFIPAAQGHPAPAVNVGMAVGFIPTAQGHHHAVGQVTLDQGFIPAAQGYRDPVGQQARALGFIPAAQGHRDELPARMLPLGFIPAAQGHLVRSNGKRIGWVSGDKVNPSGGDIRNPATLRSRERQDDGTVWRFSARQGRAETGDEDAGREGDDVAAARLGMGHAPDRG